MRQDHEDYRHLTRRDLFLAAGSGAAMTPLWGGCVVESSGMGQAGQTDAAAMFESGSRLTRSNKMEAEVVIVGGGMAGVSAALAALNSGASVILVHDRPVLGGNASSEIRLHILGADEHGARSDTDSRESGIIEEIRLHEVVRNPHRSYGVFDLLLYEMVCRRQGLSVLLNTSCCGAVMASKSRIAAVLATRPSTQEVFTIKGKMFIDTSGDGRLGAEAGAEFRTGREGRAEFGEDLAPPQPDNQMLGSSILFTTRRYDQPIPFTPPDWALRFPTCEDLPYRSHGSWEWGFWWVEWGGHIDTIRGNEKIRDELIAAALGVWDHIKNSGKHPESANWAIDWFGFIPGKRESRRFVGDHVLIQQEVQRGELFEDGVAYGGWPIDLHPSIGIHSKEKPCLQIRVPMYNIPFRCLYSRNIENLFFAGRDASMSHVAFGSTRVMATGSVMGQAAGTAAVMCIRNKCTPRELGRQAIGDLQQQLLKGDAYIIGASNGDSLDLARTAEIRASSETPQGKAANVIDGVTRGVGPKTHRWISDPQQKMPQWIELRFRKPGRVREVHLTFDTGLNRSMTLTLSNHQNAKMIRHAQPETVRDYELQILDGGGAKTIAQVTGNYLRKKIHRFDPVTASGLRLKISATNGDASARVFEIRAYE
ncbi:MAG: FAD-dependent oxidoreductase [Phycisphaerae bacterium]